MNQIDTKFKQFILDYSSDSDYIQQLNQTVQKLISNDVAMTIKSDIAPGIWRYQWRKGEKGYAKGDAVWINTDIASDVVANRKSEIIDFVESRYDLRELCSKCEDTTEFFKSVVEGTAASNISALFWLGDITQKAQVRVSKIKNNMTYPDSDQWEDLFVCDSTDESRDKLFSALSSMLDLRLSSHIADYHNAFLSSDIDDYIIKTSNGGIENIPQDGLQQYSDHVYTLEMKGIDYVIEQDYWCSGSNQSRRWYRKWKSGYLEHGGIIYVNSAASRHIRVNFAQSTDSQLSAWPIYNYLRQSGEFYQTDYATCSSLIGASSIQPNMKGDIRYTISITPMPNVSDDEYSSHPYCRQLSAGRYYVTRDVYQMENDGFSFICDSLCNYYSYHVAGFTTLA